MKFDIKLLISYEYANPAVGGRNLVRLVPSAQESGQTLLYASLLIDPEPQERLDRTDFFGNLVTEFSFSGPHDSMTLALKARVKRESAPRLGANSAPLSGLGFQLQTLRDVGARSPLHFLSASPRVPLDAGMTAFASSCVTPDRAVVDAVVSIGRAIFAQMAFDANATTVDTPAAEAFAKRRGVCQDFTHIMIACLRGIGIPAGYVSGFLRTKPPPGKPRLEGADAMHAWVQAWCGAEAGWVEFDPTNNCFAGEDHIVVARGRDYSDVAPVRGAMRISGNQKSSQAVDVIPSE